MPVGKRRVSITLPDGALYRFDAKNDPECAFSQVPQPIIALVPVPGGNRVTYGTTGYQHSAGLSVTLTRDTQGRMLVALKRQLLYSVLTIAYFYRLGLPGLS